MRLARILQHCVDVVGNNDIVVRLGENKWHEEDGKTSPEDLLYYSFLCVPRCVCVILDLDLRSLAPFSWPGPIAFSGSASFSFFLSLSHVSIDCGGRRTTATGCVVVFLPARHLVVLRTAASDAATLLLHLGDLFLVCLG